MMPDIKFLSIDYQLTPPRHSRIIARIRGSCFIMKKIAVLLFILMFLTGGMHLLTIFRLNLIENQHG